MTFTASGSQGSPAFQFKAKRQIMTASLACNFRRVPSADARKTYNAKA